MCSILLMEDHKIMAETLVRLLRTEGNFEVADVAESAEDALDWLLEPKDHVQVDLARVDVVLRGSMSSDRWRQERAAMC
jgi:DNA-binding NarL/FixJ family response regulator